MSTGYDEARRRGFRRAVATTYVEIMGSASEERIKLTNADKVLYPAGRRRKAVTKADVFDYSTRIAEVMVPHIAGRPATRKRWPNGVEQPDFFEKQLAASAPEWLVRGRLSARERTQ